MDSMTDIGKAKVNTVSTDAADLKWNTTAYFNKPWSSGPFVPPESFVIPSNHTADDLLKRAVSQR